MKTEVVNPVSENSLKPSRYPVEIEDIKGLKTLSNEDVLNLRLSVKGKLIGGIEIKKFRESVQLNGELYTEVCIHDKGIGLPELIQMYKYALQNKENSAEKGGVTALAFHLALNEKEDQIVVFYEPLYLKKKKIAERGASSHGLYEAKGGCKYKLEESTREWIKLDDAYFEQYCERYRKKIRLKHHEAGDFHSFSKGTDTDAVIYTFQLIFTLLYENGPQAFEEEQKVLYPYHALFIPPLWHWNIIPRKHSILLLPKDLKEFLQQQSADEEDEFYDKYADRSRLCPPNCYRELIYELYP